MNKINQKMMIKTNLYGKTIEKLYTIFQIKKEKKRN